jgi:L-ascorbate metabolism protein UlaG (beta-lactamase superfamily)
MQMSKPTLTNPVLRKRAQEFGRLVRHSAVTPTSGQTHKPKLGTDDDLGVTFIGHSSFLVQIGGVNVVIDPNFARWLFVLKRLRRPGIRLRDLPSIDLVLVTHAHFDHLHRPSLRAIVQQAQINNTKQHSIVVPHQMKNIIS